MTRVLYTYINNILERGDIYNIQWAIHTKNINIHLRAPARAIYIYIKPRKLLRASLSFWWWSLDDLHRQNNNLIPLPPSHIYRARASIQNCPRHTKIINKFSNGQSAAISISLSLSLARFDTSSSAIYCVSFVDVDFTPSPPEKALNTHV